MDSHEVYIWEIFFRNVRENLNVMKLWQEWPALYMKTNKHVWSYLAQFFCEWEMVAIWRLRIACWITKVTNTHSEYVHTYCFSTATIVARTRPNVTLYVHWPSVLFCLSFVLFCFVFLWFSKQTTIIAAFARVCVVKWRILLTVLPYLTLFISIVSPNRVHRFVFVKKMRCLFHEVKFVIGCVEYFD